MRIDLNYIRKIMLVFLESEKAYITLLTLKKKGINLDEERFIFHIDIMLERRLISNSKLESGALKSIGIARSHDNIYINAVPIRLTQEGHDFVKALEDKKIIGELTSTFKGASFDVLQNIAKKLLEKKFFKLMKDD